MKKQNNTGCNVAQNRPLGKHSNTTVVIEESAIKYPWFALPK
jgi:hypothetical protein